MNLVYMYAKISVVIDCDDLCLVLFLIDRLISVVSVVLLMT
jgi:hypothetical protein